MMKDTQCRQNSRVLITSGVSMVTPESE